MDTPRDTHMRLARALVWREWREDRLFGLAVVLALAASAHWCRPPAVLASLTCGLILGVRAYAPDAASGTVRFIGALPVSGRAVLRARLGLRLAAVLAGVAVALPMNSRPELLLVGAATLYACLVGLLAGQVLDRATTAFAAGGVMLVVLGQLVAPVLTDPGLESAWPHAAASLTLCLSAGVLVALSHWIAEQR